MQFVKLSSRLGPLLRSSLIELTPRVNLSQSVKLSYPLLSSRSSAISNVSLSQAINVTSSPVRFYSDHVAVSKEMEAFLAEEIKAEKANNKPMKKIPGFEVSTNGALIKLNRKFKDEKIVIRLDVNGSTTDGEQDESAEIENFQPGPLLSKPSFAVEIHKSNGKVLCLTCNFVQDEPPELDDGSAAQQEQNQEQPNEDLFEIEAFTVVDNKSGVEDIELGEETYMGDASLIDGQLYDLLMDYLDERGLTKEWASHLVDFCTAYEHERYIELLEKLKEFAKN